MKLITKKMIIPHRAGHAPLCGLVTYIHPDQPILLRRIGWEVSNDIHDDFADVISHDNGRTWGEPRPALSSTRVDGGVIVHTENAALYLPDRNLLIHWTNDKFESSLEGGVNSNYSYKVRVMIGDPAAVSAGTAPPPFISDFGFKQGVCISFSTPLADSRGRILAPVQWQKQADTQRSIQALGLEVRKDLPDVLVNVWEVGLLIGEFQPDGKLTWRLGKAVPCEFGKSCRGMCEGTLAELPDGRFGMILRGCNHNWPDRPNYKWLSFSDDGGETWSEAVPLPCEDGRLIESSATGSALFRSIQNGRLYWIGNLCLEGRRPHGNMPRSPIYLAEMQEDPLAIKRQTIAVIDRAQPGEHPDTQHSNFKFYQDRETGDVVLYLTRYGERGYENDRWLCADHYQYRVALEE